MFALGHTALNNAGNGSFVYILAPGSGSFLGLECRPFPLLALQPRTDRRSGARRHPGANASRGKVRRRVLQQQPQQSRRSCVQRGRAGAAGPPNADGFGVGVFKADRWNHIASVVVPGDKAPNGGVFDDAIEGWTNDPGDIAFDAHVQGEECIDLGGGFEPLVCGLERLQDAEERQNPVDRPPGRSSARRRNLSPGLRPGDERCRRSRLCRRSDPAARPSR